MGLLRNTDFTITDPETRKQVRAGDPEYHIRRLQHFGAGMGVDLTSTKDYFTNKRLFVTGPNHGDETRRLGSNYLRFDVHDEGLQVPWGITDSAIANLQKNNAHNLKEVHYELLHRTPFDVSADDHHHGPIEHAATEGMVIKHVNDISEDYDDGDDIPLTWSSWDNYKNTNYKEGMTSVEGSFRHLNAKRIPPSREIMDQADDALRNPDKDMLSFYLRNRPHALSGQFVGITMPGPMGFFEGGKRLPESGPGFPSEAPAHTDMLDLKTGTWAKMHPDGYFPD
jgi:hypothetical protein